MNTSFLSTPLPPQTTELSNLIRRSHHDQHIALTQLCLRPRVEPVPSLSWPDGDDQCTGAPTQV